MEYTDVIKLILNDFERSFNTSAKIIYDTRENVITNNPNFRIGNTAGGFYDTKSRTIYLFSDTIEKIRNKNYDNKFNNNDNGLAFLIFASFHELEHVIQREYPERLKNQFDFSRIMYAVEQVIISTYHFDPDIKDFDYHKNHDNFLLEIDADIKGNNNARGFVEHHDITGINQKYFDLVKIYNDFKINNYDIPILLNQFIKIIKKYPDMLGNKGWINCDELVQFFNLDGTIKSIDELMKIQSVLTPYIVSSSDCVKSLDGLLVNNEQVQFINKCLKSVVGEHDEKQKRLKGIPNIEYVVEELKRYTQVNGDNSKKVNHIANENYYNYLRQVQGVFQDMEKKSTEFGEPGNR